ncbi:hypothetical protein E2562_011844 [Oryza meyeriana var. granulata]|uniref:Uncharacterized protein n=1 Tax=Oryza meyeriana var. granulata TaxID=110450 RepID=A0A6G1CNH3_9ORYZ|nr:hypothetical protein E2562_011844 [Oryza meyeriana var. granulata]
MALKASSEGNKCINSCLRNEVSKQLIILELKEEMRKHSIVANATTMKCFPIKGSIKHQLLKIISEDVVIDLQRKGT